MWFHIKLCWKQTNVSILLVFILELISDLCSFAFSIVFSETINTFKVMFLSLDSIFLAQSLFFYPILLFSKKLTLPELHIVIFNEFVLNQNFCQQPWPRYTYSSFLALSPGIQTLSNVFPAWGSLVQMQSFNCTCWWELLWLQPIQKTPETAQVACLKRVPFGKEEI